MNTPAENTGNPAAHAPGMPVIAVIGDGQLARMMQTEAIELGCSIRVLAGAPDSSAAQVCADVLIGDYTDIGDLRRAVDGADAVTFDHEHVPNEHLDALIAEGVNVQPQPSALIFAQDKLVMRKRLGEIGAPVPRFAAIDSVEDAAVFFDEVDGAVCLKARRGGYDGNGVWFPDSREGLGTLVEKLLSEGVPLMAEEKLSFTRELSAMVARTPSGEVRPWPVVESVQSGGICVEAIAPAPGMSDEQRERAEKLSVSVAEALGVTGVLAVELFEVDGEIFVNELAMRPHNTGHWTQEGSVTSQFEQHLRAVLDFPLGSTETLAPVTVMANVLGADKEPEMSVTGRCVEVWRRFPEAKIHLYGKGYRPGRKLGHVNVVGSDVEQTRKTAAAAAHFLMHGEWDDNYLNKKEH
ncbi:5-(carboxyamino)imidazole ribonucleotide synthase [Corynebacterium doosanense]|uniref:N5-carboxyaminoimidazole ribonucleotide synthase n=2 Tax=Corynebacterium TaxID=1716 RepID=A0A097IE93_9CORY|nr:5-(carboxyamino)imidazole ribonucleotide synthase [Corynebacterium doosanense]AIT60430.1 phosphoribosylaminoimidazole carboxylase [Corynebacterium doosanense CAU 212 = DSM 45436]